MSLPTAPVRNPPRRRDAGGLRRRAGVAALAIGLLGLAVVPAARAQQEAYIGLERNRQATITLVLEDLAYASGATGSDARRVGEVVNNDLSMTDLFTLVPAPAGTANQAPPDTAGGGPYPGARVIAGGALRVSGGDLYFDAYLKEYPSYRSVLARSYHARPEWFRELAHRFADDIVLYLTGDEGISRTRVAFVSDATGAKELYLIDLDGENVRQITRDKSIALSPAWSPDLSRIAFVSFRRGDPDLYQVSLSSGEITPLSARPGPEIGPSFSRDGSRLAYTATIDGNSEIFVADAAGKNPRRITNNRGIDTSPTFSPRGTEICFTSDRSGSPQLYVCDIEGGNLRRLTFDGEWNDSPDWSPDGQSIVYVTRQAGGFRVCWMAADGSRAAQLTTGPGSEENPKWSPDGRKIVFSSSREGRRALYTINSNGTGLRRLTYLAGDCYGPSWGNRPSR